MEAANPLRTPGMTRISPERLARIEQSATEFEAMFLGAMVNEMMKDSMPKTMNGGFGEEMFRNQMGEEIGRNIADQGGIGLAEQVRDMLIRREAAEQ